MKTFIQWLESLQTVAPNLRFQFDEFDPSTKSGFVTVFVGNQKYKFMVYNQHDLDRWKRLIESKPGSETYVWGQIQIAINKGRALQIIPPVGTDPISQSPSPFFYSRQTTAVEPLQEPERLKQQRLKLA